MKEENILFYNNFFKKKNFLDYKKNNYEFLKEQGFNNSKIKNCKLILEIGAGKGRYTIPIIKKKIFPKLKQYHIVEPSNSIYDLKKKINSKNIFFHNKYYKDAIKDLNLVNIKFDLIIFSGVIPHINLKLRKIFSLSKIVLKKKGKIKIVSSFYGTPLYFEKKMLKIKNKNLIKMFCILKVMFNFLFKKKVFFGTNFLRSTQKKFIDQYNQFLEFYSIKPYNIFYGYNYYYKKLKEENFSVIDVDPYSISLLASLNSKEFKISKKKFK